MAIFQEFQARGFSHLLPYIQLNRPYPKKPRRKVDLYVKLPRDKLPPEIVEAWSRSGVCEKNWIEVKFFGGAERKAKSSTEPKVQNLGDVLADLLRLKFYAEEGGKYLLLVFNREPRYYLPSRRYLDLLMGHGRDQVEIDLLEEPKTVHKSLGKDLMEILREKNPIKLELLKYVIEPMLVKGLLQPTAHVQRRSRNHIYMVSEPQYYFYLIRLLELFDT